MPKVNKINLIVCAALALLITGCASYPLMPKGGATTPRPNGEVEMCKRNPASYMCYNLAAFIHAKVKHRIRLDSDQHLYGVEERWVDLTPGLLDGFHRGDCEEVAIASAGYAIELGVPRELIRLIDVNDGNSAHLVASIGPWVMDNRWDTVKHWHALRDPVSSRLLSESVWRKWLGN